MRRMESEGAVTKPHAVCIPYPSQGHIKPMMHLSKLLHSRGFHVTFVNTEFSHKRLLRSRGPDSLTGLDDFRFETIQDGLPPSDEDATQDQLLLCATMKKKCVIPFRNLITKINGSPGLPSVTCIVSDGCMSFTQQVADEFHITEVLLWPMAACGFMGFFQFSELIGRGYTPLKDESYLTNGYLDTLIDWIPGMPSIRLRDLPRPIRTTDPHDLGLNFMNEEAQNACKAAAIILNTFEGLEYQVIEAIRSKFKRIYTLGPLTAFCRNLCETPTKSMDSYLWKEASGCVEWLNQWEAGSVVYVSFGSIAVLTSQQLIELAWGLANSGHPFVWIIRPDLVSGESAILPLEFTTETNERGLIVSWCPQEQVLNHPSVGGFLTHCGWNSMQESICAGVPMICCPSFADQQTNCRYACNEWGVGMEIDSDLKGAEIEASVREVMVGEKGKEIKMKAKSWKETLLDAVKPGGSSYVNLDKLISEVLLDEQPLYGEEEEVS